MLDDRQTYQFSRKTLTTAATAIKVIPILLALSIVPLMAFGFSTGNTDPTFIWINIGLIVLLCVIVGTMMMVAGHVQQSVWKATIDHDCLILNTLSQERRIMWTTISNFEKQAADKGQSYYVLTLDDNEKLTISASIDKTGKLFDQIRERSSLPSFKRHEMPIALQIQTIFGLPVALMFFGFILSSSAPSWMWGIAVFSAFYVIFMCMFLALWYETSETGLKIKTVFSYCETDWKNVSTMRLSSYLKTPQGCFFLSGWMPDLEVFKKTVRTQIANQKNIQWVDGGSEIAQQAKSNYNSDKVVWLLSLVSLLTPLHVTTYVAPVALLCVLFEFLLGKSSLTRFALCLAMSVPGVVAMFTVSDMVSPNSPAIVRLVESNRPGFNLSEYVRLAKPVNVFGYEITSPAETDDTSVTTTESGQLRKWHGKCFLGGPNAITFMVADEHRTGKEGTERYEWAHPPGLANIERVDSNKQEFGGLVFTVNQWKATSGIHKISGFDYIANDKKLMVAMRSYDTHEADARARAEAVMKHFRKVSDEGVPRHIPQTAPKAGSDKPHVDTTRAVIHHKKSGVSHQRRSRSK